MPPYDLLGVLELGAPETEYDPEMQDFARLISAGEAINPELVAAVCHIGSATPTKNRG